MIRAFDAFSLPLLRWFDPEDAHRLAIQGLKLRAVRDRRRLKRSGIAGGPCTIIAPPPILTASSFTDKSVAPHTTYYYVVSASSVAGEGQNSIEVAVTTPAGTPAAAALRPLNSLTRGRMASFIVTVVFALAAAFITRALLRKD